MKKRVAKRAQIMTLKNNDSESTSISICNFKFTNKNLRFCTTFSVIIRRSNTGKNHVAAIRGGDWNFEGYRARSVLLGQIRRDKVWKSLWWTPSDDPSFPPELCKVERKHEKSRSNDEYLSAQIIWNKCFMWVLSFLIFFAFLFVFMKKYCSDF